MDINLCRLHGFVTEPEGDDRLIDAVLQELHRSAVPEDVGTDAFARNKITQKLTYFLAEVESHSIEELRLRLING